MNARSLWGCVAVGLLSSPLAAAEPGLRYAKAVQAPSLAQQELVRVALDADIYAATQDGLADLRLLDGDGRPVPFVLRKMRTTSKRTVRSAWTAQNPSLRPLEDGGLEITVELRPDDPRPNGLTLITPLDNFENRIRVESSAGGELWEALAEETLLFDYSRYMDVRKDSVSFPETSRRRFRITIDDVTARQESELLELTRRLQGADEAERVERFSIERRPFRIDRLEFWRESDLETPTDEARQSYPPVDFQVDQDADDRRTVVLVTTRREPLTSLALETPDRNFSRSAAVEVERVHGVRREWQAIGHATVSRLDFQDLHREQLSLTIPESRHDRYRIVIENRDSPPIDITGVKAEGNVQEVVFVALPDVRYHVAYGNADAHAANLDTAAVESLLQSRFSPTTAQLGEQRLQTGAAAAADVPWTDWLSNPVLLTIVIALLVIALGFGLYQASRRIDEQH